MKEFRKARGVTERYSSLAEFREARATKPNKKQVEKEQTWKEKERESFSSECPVCKQKLTYIYGTNVCVCKNPECKGYKNTKTDEDGNEIVWYTPVISYLNGYKTNKGLRIFDEN